MQRQRKEKEIILGKERLIEKAQIKENETKKVSAAEYNRAIEDYKKIIKFARFD